jgi:hypothetical protein
VFFGYSSVEGAFETPQLSATHTFGEVATIRFAHAACGRMVEIAALAGSIVHTNGCDYVGWVICFIRTGRNSGSPLVTKTELSRLFVMRNDAKLLRHVRWQLAPSRSVEQRRASALRVFLAMAIGKSNLREFYPPQVRAKKASKKQVGMRRAKKHGLQNWPARSFVCAVIIVMIGACSGSESSLMRLVPLESCAIMKLDWSSLRRDPDLKRLIKGAEFETVLERIGIDSDSVDSVAVFSSLDSRTTSGLLLRGSFNRKQVVADLKKTGWEENLLENRNVYLNGTDCIASLGRNTLFAGTREGALAVFRAQESMRESIVASPAFKKINDERSMNGKPVRAFLLIPQGTLDMADAALTASSVALSLFQLGGIGQLLKAVNVARGFGLSLDNGKHDEYPAELSVLMRDEEAAVFVNGSLNAMKTISELAATDKRDLEGLRAVQKMKVDRRGEVLRLNLEIPVTALLPPGGR